MKKATSLLLSFTSALTLLQADITIEPGWGMYGFGNDTNVSEILSNQNLEIIWAWDATTQRWKAFSADPTLMSLIQSNSTIDDFTTLKSGDGCWILNKDTAPVIITQTVDNNALFLANIITGASTGLAGAGSASISALNNITSSSSSFNFARVLYSSNSSYDSNGNLNIYMPGMVNGSDANATIKFSINGNDINASNVMDTSGAAYGATDLNTTLINIGTFFTELSQLTSQTEQYSYVASNITPLITAVTTHKEAPLFSLVGSADFQSFMNSFPSDTTSAYSADYASLGTAYAALDLANNPPNVDFSKITMAIAVDVVQEIVMSSFTVNLPTLYSSAATLKDVIDNTPITFLGDGNGTISISSDSATMSNIDMNMSVDTAGTYSSIQGTYHIDFTKDTHHYTGVANFSQNGCEGADIYDNGSFLSRMKIFDDGLWIVDENNVKIEKVQ